MGFIRTLKSVTPCSILRGFVTSTALLAILCIALIMIVEVVSRYVFKSPLGWNVYLIERYLMVGMVFLGLSYAYRTKSHVAVDVIFNKMEERGKKIAEVISTVVILTVLVLIIWGGAAAAYDSWYLGESPPPGGSTLPWPTWIWKSLIPLGVIIMTLDVIEDFFKRKNNPKL